MIQTAEEFVRLRVSEDLTEQHRASQEQADISVWLTVIEKYPEFKPWVVHNKTIQIEILELLSDDPNPEVRAAVARKRKMNQRIKAKLSQDIDENVRSALLSNTKMTVEELKKIKTDDAIWLQKQQQERIKNAGK